MTSPTKGSPTAPARSAFRSGMLLATLAAAVVVGVAYWQGLITPSTVGLLALLSPVYLVVAASAINSWLGYGGTTAPLKRVTDPPQPSRWDGTPEQPIAEFVDDPRYYLVGIAVLIGLGLLVAALEYPGVAFFVLLFAMLSIWLTAGRFLLPRLETYFEDRDGASADHSGGKSLSAELKAGITSATLMFVVLAGFVLLLGTVFGPSALG
ncbi:MAG: hypothetical protein V5A23_03505 [Halobacteriales archaeon]